MWRRCSQDSSWIRGSIMMSPCLVRSGIRRLSRGLPGVLPGGPSAGNDAAPALRLVERGAGAGEVMRSGPHGALEVDLPVVDGVEPARGRSGGLAHRGDVGDVVGGRVEDQLDLQLRQVCADAVVRAVAAERQVRVRITQDVEGERILEDVLVE